MEFLEVVRRRRMTRNFSPDPVPDEVLERILDTGRRGPSAGFSQGVSFISITNLDRRTQIAALCGEHGYVAAGFGPFVSGAPLQVIICTSEAVYQERYQQPDKRRAASREPVFPVPYWYTDAGSAKMLLLLAATNEGLATAFVGIHDIPGLKRLLGIPKDVLPLGVALLGYPAPDKRSGSLKRGRKPLSEVHHREGW